MVVSLIYKLGNMTTQELIAYEFSQRVSKPQAVIAVQVYLELVEVKKYYSVQYKFYENIDKMIISGKKSKEAPMCAFIPITLSEYLDFPLLQKFIKVHDCPLTCVAIVGSDSTTVYYQIEDGLIEPDNSTTKNTKLDRQLQLDRDLEKHREIIEDAALLGIKVIIPGKSFEKVENCVGMKIPMEISEAAPTEIPESSGVAGISTISKITD